MPDRLSASDLAARIAQNAEEVCRTYLRSGRKEGRYWLVGDALGTPGGSLYVRLSGPDRGKGAAGKWTEYVAARVMLRRCDWALSHDRSSAFAQHNLSARGLA